ncbi:uncharacterized protein LOC127526132 [Erpetoichthys calabaricus]|uniref:uncharacterized protein LOC127526132 n=1 Tax=Erpetoichthys calabaricus TaxID=27687 RepID=UPI0022340FB9|nr:uncharacterized protein LOC127526132 [Erpetoichthys calabaricus]
MMALGLLILLIGGVLNEVGATTLGGEATETTQVRWWWNTSTKSRRQENTTCPENQSCNVLTITTGDGCTIYSSNLKVSGVKPQKYLIECSENLNITWTSKVTWCTGPWNGFKVQCEVNATSGEYTSNKTGPIGWINATDIINRTIPMLAIAVWARTPITRQSHVEPIIDTCKLVSMTAKRTKVTWQVTFPLLPQCKRAKRAWYDTFLGGVGTTLGTLNTVDNEITANKLENVGRHTHKVADQMARWLPQSMVSHQQTVNWEQHASDWIIMASNDTRWLNVSTFMNWTVCTFNILQAQIQKNNMQMALRTNNMQTWQDIWNISSSLWLMIKPEYTRCNDTICNGYWFQYNVTTMITLCRYHILPVVAHGHPLVLLIIIIALMTIFNCYVFCVLKRINNRARQTRLLILR